jgi:hypothetical protein
MGGMAIPVTCPACGKSGEVPDSFAGRTAKCPRCKELIKVPAGEPVGVAIATDPVFDVDSFVREAETAREHAPPQIAHSESSPQKVVIVGLRIPLGDAVRLIITFWVASFFIGLFLVAVGFAASVLIEATR